VKSEIPMVSVKRMLRELKECGILGVLREGRGRQPATYVFSELIEIAEREEA
jgi:hypothetical protein